MMRKLSLDRIAFKLALLYSSAGKRPRGAAAPRSILVGATTFLGDMLMTAPMVMALKRRYPQARITMLVRPEYRELAACIPGIDDVLEERHSWHWLRKTRQGHGGYDLAVVALENRIVPLVAALGARAIIAYPDPKGRYRHLISDPVAFPTDQPQHLARLLLRLVGAEHDCLTPPYLDISGQPPFAGTPSEPFVIIHCGARSAFRRWPPARYHQVAAACIAEGYHVVFTGTAEDGPAIALIRQGLPADKVLDWQNFPAATGQPDSTCRAGNRPGYRGAPPDESAGAPGGHYSGTWAIGALRTGHAIPTNILLLRGPSSLPRQTHCPRAICALDKHLHPLRLRPARTPLPA
jgi:hypothetical protein